ncbi:MAG: hypothetical protein JW991_01385 [Candidatus Pacebacteria bacterium]|nr:hypothetical protein [Candidatus Paceibacterota bacterium]
MISPKKIYLVAPSLIPQPTWGGKYILEAKGWQNKGGFKDRKIGQSYELFSGSFLDVESNTSASKEFGGWLGNSSDVRTAVYQGKKANLVKLEKLIASDPKLILGPKVLKTHGRKPGILIKFTQALGNSFQIHIGQRIVSKKWQAKAESWYYLEPGLLTLGLRKKTKPVEFKKCCQRIDAALNQISLEIKKNRKTAADGRSEALKIVKRENPWLYVNLVTAKKDDLIDLSEGGLHHSWEEDSSRFPLGNLVYELCQDVMDPVSTLRCFDRGKIKDDGSLRKLDISDYFRYLNSQPEYNNPENHRLRPKLVWSGTKGKIEALLRTGNYCLDRFKLKGSYQGESARTRDSYHHLFVQEGRVFIKAGRRGLVLTRCHSAFIPAAIGAYELMPLGKKEAVILKTFVN